MATDRFQLAAEGWRIISRYPDARESARYLLRWLAEVLDLSAAALIYHDDSGNYGWKERVGRFIPGRPAEEEWTRPFPVGSSFWSMEGNRARLEAHAPVLDLLAEQWMRVDVPVPRQTKTAAEGADGIPRFRSWTAVSAASRSVLSRLTALCPSRDPLLLIGEHGSGRTHLARIIHGNGSDPSAPFGGPGDGYRTGTLFVPRWSSLDSREQSAVLSDPRRLIAARRSGESAEEASGIRKEWSRRTGGTGLILTVPSLRERKDDIPALAGVFLEELTACGEREAPEISPGALDNLMAYRWPGNVPELKECLAGIIDNAEDPARISVDQLPPAVRGAVNAPAESSFPEKLVALEYEALKRELARQRGNMTRTARALGLTPRQVSWRVRKYGIDPRDFKPHLRSAPRDGV